MRRRYSVVGVGNSGLVEKLECTEHYDSAPKAFPGWE
jgi:hypothetical protein